LGIANGPDFTMPPRYEAELEASDSDNGDLFALTKNGIAANWTWSHSSGAFPAGLDLEVQAEGTSSSATKIEGVAETAGSSNFTIRYRPDQRVVQGELFFSYSMEIYESPRFITDPDALDDGMDWRPLHPPEPSDPLYRDYISATGFPVVPESAPEITWNWEVSDPGELPPTTEGGVPMTLSATGTPNLYTISGNPQTWGGARGDGESKNFKFNVTITASLPGNDNIDKVAIARDFNIWVWERRYLNIEGTDGERRCFVRRVPRQDELDEVNWEATGFADENYRFKRAVMPGTQGEIRVALTGDNVRWEVIPDPGFENANSRVIIGGDHNIHHSGRFALARITMPENNSKGERDGGDVYIRGAEADAWEWEHLLADGTIGVRSGGGFITFLSDLGDGNQSMRWVLVSEDDTFPPGMNRPGGDSFMTSITSSAGGPLPPEKTYNFVLGFFLPGTMRVNTPLLSISINSPNNILGDVDGVNGLDLKDLILLGMYVREEIPTLPNLAMGRIVSVAPAGPNVADFNALAAYFARPEVNLAQSPSTP
jgi:hypothetical protein